MFYFVFLLRVQRNSISLGMYILYRPLISPLGPYMVFWGQCYEGQGGGRRRQGLLTEAKWENNSLKPSISTIADNFRDAVYNEKADIDWKKMLCIYHTLASFSMILATSLIALISQPGTSHSGIKNTKLTAHAQLGCYLFIPIRAQASFQWIKAWIILSPKGKGKKA